MENNELNNRIIKNVRNRVVVSNLESEEKMKISKKKQVVSLMTVVIGLFTGGFITVNAATNGELANKVKETIKDVMYLKVDGQEKELKPTEYINLENNHTIQDYNFSEGEATLRVQVDKTNLDNKNLQINGEMQNNEINLTIEN